jgi:hypothetical protein
MNPFLKLSLSCACIVALASTAGAAPEGENLFSSGDFESATKDTPMQHLPKEWSAYDWGPGDNPIEVTRQNGAGRDGGVAVLARNKAGISRAGIFTHVPLPTGTYELSVWARAEKGQTAKVRMFLANAYSRTFTIGDEWQLLSFTNSATAGLEKSGKGAEISYQNVSDRENSVWFDDAVLRRVPDVKYKIIPDTRPDRPRTILNSQINVNYLHDTAADWAKRGFDGFNLLGIMRSQDDNPWASDGDAKTQGEEDALLQAVRACNVVCKKVGIDSNFVKIGLYGELPDPFDDAAWKKITENFRQGARFARMSDCVGVSLDTEYVAKQYQPNWPGYAKNPHPLPELKSKFEQRWNDITAAMVQEYPAMVLTILPEGLTHYGELYQDLFAGIVGAMAKAQAPGGVHVMTESTYHMVGINALENYAHNLQEETQEKLPAKLVPYWKKRCSIALGAWPLGYYRPIMKDGKRIGWSGREETFGDELVGSYADKSAWYTPEVFATQMTGLNSFSPRYNWIYAHGDVFWQWSEAQKEHYEGMVGNRIFNVLLPTAPNIDDYLAVLAHPMRAERE